MTMLVSILQDPSVSDPSPWLAVFGRAHPVLLHSPLGLLPAIAVLEFGALMLRKPAQRGAVLTLSWLLALATAAAAGSGLVLAGEPGYTGDTVGQHKVLGLTLAGLCLLAAVLSCLQNRRAFRIVVLLACGVMLPAGHLGGALTHGSDFLFAPLQTTAPQTDDASATRDSAPPPAPPASEFERTIAPILERTCSKCHNEDKQKGELLLTTIAGIQKGGDNGAVIVPGKPEESPLLTRCQLPLDDDDHMPPEGKPQPTAAELAALAAWIAAGAAF